MRGGKTLPSELTSLVSAFSGSLDAFVITRAPNAGGGPTMVHANAAFCDLCGYGLDDLIGRSPGMLQGSATDRETGRRIGMAVRRGEAVRATLVNYRKDGNPYTVDIAITPLPSRSGEITHFMAVEREITAPPNLIGVDAIPALVAPGQAQGNAVPAVLIRPGDMIRTLPAALTPRERDALRLIGDGLSNRGVAERLGITESTVKQHLQNAYRKLGVRTRTQALCGYPELAARPNRAAQADGRFRGSGLGEAGRAQAQALEQGDEVGT